MRAHCRGDRETRTGSGPGSRSPRANAFSERFMLTVRTEVSDRMLIFGDGTCALS
jgi:hypothetical protein